MKTKNDERPHVEQPYFFKRKEKMLSSTESFKRRGEFGITMSAAIMATRQCKETKDPIKKLHCTEEGMWP